MYDLVYVVPASARGTTLTGSGYPLVTYDTWKILGVVRNCIFISRVCVIFIRLSNASV